MMTASRASIVVETCGPWSGRRGNCQCVKLLSNESAFTVMGYPPGRLLRVARRIAARLLTTRFSRGEIRARSQQCELSAGRSERRIVERQAQQHPAMRGRIQ